MKRILFSIGFILSVGGFAAHAQSTVSLNANPPALPIVDAGSDTAITAGGLIVLNGNASGGTAPVLLEWTPALNMPDNTILNPSVNVPAPTTFYLTATDANNCIVVDSVFVDVLMSVKNFAGGNLRIYPNPAKDHLMIEHQINGKFTLRLSNILGQIVAEKEVITSDGTEKFSFGRINSGHYILQITQGSQSKSLKVIIQ